MGGNINVYGINAEKIRFSEYNHQDFVKDTTEFLDKLNEIFHQKYEEKLWVHPLDEYYNGSTRYLMKDDSMVRYKPYTGDIDIMIDDKHKEKLFDLIIEYENKRITDKVSFISVNRQSRDKLGFLMSCVLKFEGIRDFFFQIDFNFCEFEDDKPTEWYKFSHYSCEEDTKHGIKACNHKFLLRALFQSLFFKSGVKILTPKSTQEKPRYQKYDSLSLYKFSNEKGLRLAYNIVDEDENLYQVKEDKEYIQNLKEIFKVAFEKEPTNQELKQFWSFTGLAKLIKKYLTTPEQNLIQERYFDILWGKEGVKTERDSIEIDFETKIKGYEHLNKTLEIPGIFKENASMLVDFYDNYHQEWFNP